MLTRKIGQRTDVIVKANMAPDSAVFMRANITAHCSTANQVARHLFSPFFPPFFPLFSPPNYYNSLTVLVDQCRRCDIL